MCHIFFTGHKNIETLLFKSWGHHTKSRYVSGSNNGRNKAGSNNRQKQNQLCK